MSAEIHETKAQAIEVMMPAKVTGWLAFYRKAAGDAWQQATRVRAESDPVLPFYAFRTRGEAIMAAQEAAWVQIVSIKLVAVDFEVTVPSGAGVQS